MNIYTLVTNILPPDKRTTTIKAFINALSSPLQWLSDIWEAYVNGSSIQQYVAGTYSYLDEVTYQKKVYVSLSDNNTASPTDSTKWYKYQDNFRGLKFRVNIDGTRSRLEYALNKYFGTIYLPYPSTSQIYITNNSVISGTFFVGLNAASSSEVGISNGDFVGLSGSSSFSENFSINVPTSAGIDELEITNFAKQFVPLSISFKIIYY